MKSYTDIEQSKKLAQILPLESADMSWVSNGLGKPFARTISIKGDPEELCACWSLAALLDVLPYYEINNWGDSMQFDVGNNALAPEGDETLLDLVVDMICDLHEQKLL